MSEVKYKLKKQRFIEWLLSDRDDRIYWGNRFCQDLINEHKVTVTLQEMFDERDEIPVYILEGDYDQIDGDDYIYDLNKIELIN